MWKRKELKVRAKQVVKKNYWTAIVVCFLIALFTGEFGTSIIGIWQKEDAMDPYYITSHKDEIIDLGITNQNIDIAMKKEEEKVAKIEEKKEALNDFEEKILRVIEANLDSMTKSQKFAIRISDAVKSFNFKQTILGINFSVMAIISIIFTIIIANPLVVGCKKYFLKARRQTNTKISVISEIFKRKSWINVVVTMLLKNIYNYLWYLTIIVGFIKTYEYKMIPYILAENPKIDRKKAFKLSKQMMKGSKWKAFILDVSFIGWEMISIFTFGLLNIFYINPYRVATVAELYETLKEQAITKKYKYYEELKSEN